MSHPSIPPPMATRPEAPRGRLGSLGVLVDLTFSEFGQCLVGLLFLGECFFKQLNGLLETELRRPGPKCAVSCDFIMFDRLRRREQPGVEGGRALELLHYFLPLLDYAHDGIASFAARRLVNLLEDFLKPSHVFFG